VVAWGVALGVTVDPVPVLAPLTVLLVVQLTVFETVTSGLQRVGSVVAGVLVAVALTEWFGISWWSLGLVILAGLVVAHFLNLGDQRLEAPISAMLVLVGGSAGVAEARVVETLIGAVVGVTVMTVLSPSFLEPAGDAVSNLAYALGGLFEDMGRALTRGWPDDELQLWQDAVAELDRLVGRAHRAVARSEASLRLNPRRRWLGSAGGMRAGLPALEHSVVLARVIAWSLLELDDDTGRIGPDPKFRRALAVLLVRAGEAVVSYGQLVTSDLAGPRRNNAPLVQALARARAAHAVATAAAETSEESVQLWRAYGDLLANTGRLLDELDLDRLG
jgi:hypothetical protein